MNEVRQGFHTCSQAALAKLMGWLSNGPAHLFIAPGAILSRGKAWCLTKRNESCGIAPRSAQAEYITAVKTLGPRHFFIRPTTEHP